MRSSKRSQVFSWCLYDWASSSLATIIFTFVFSVYFSREIVGDEVQATAYWGYTIGIAGGVIAFLGPILGAISDVYGSKKPLLFFLTISTILATIALFWAMPDTSYIAYSLIFVGIATIGFELAQAQYNSMLSGVSTPNNIGRVSGWAWGMGYLGGLVCLLIALVFFIGMRENETGIFGISNEDNLNIRSTCLLVAAWYFVFSLPLFFFVPDRKKNKINKPIIISAFKSLKEMFIKLFSTSGNITRYLIASAIYRDGLNTLFMMGGLYAAGTFGMGFQEILIFAIGLNIASGSGAFLFAYLDDFLGSKVTIILSLIGLIILGIGIVIVDNKDTFMIIAMGLGFFIGPVQSSSRTMMARLSPKELSSELFGFYAMTGKSVAFIGPLVFAFVTQLMDNQRWGIATIILFWIVGLILLLRVKEKVILK